MESNSGSLFEAFLHQHDAEQWQQIIKALLPSIHKVDQTAVQIWFYFHPLALHQAFEAAEDADALARRLLLKGTYSLSEQIDSSHQFLYGHRYWAQVKAAVVDFATSSAAPRSLELATQIKDIAETVAKKLNIDSSLVVGITAVAFMTLQQVGIEAFKTAPGTIKVDKRVLNKTPEQVLRDRARDSGQGLLGFLKGDRKEYRVTFNETADDAVFKIIATQHLTTAAALDKREYHAKDSRCVPGEGPIPIECRSAACGTCWVGILGGNENTSKVGRLESERIKTFGYIDTDEERPLIRLACMTQAMGPVSIVIPAWNGVFGKYLRRQQEEVNYQLSE